MIGSYPFQDDGRPNTNIVVRSRDAAEARRRQGRGRGRCWRSVRGELAADGVSARVERAWRTSHGGAAGACREKAFPVSWDQFHRDARALAWRLAAAGPFTAIVAITRGGLVPAAIVARELNVRLIETVCVASYHDYTKQGELRVLKNVARRRSSSSAARAC